MNELKFIVNDQAFTKEELLQWCFETSEHCEPWEYDHCMFILNWFNDEDYVEVKTSGSTGEPKRIQLSKKYLAASARMTADFFHLNEGTKALLCLPSSYIGGKMVIVRALVNHWQLKWIKPATNPLLAIDEEYGIVSLTPPQVHEIMQTNPVKLDQMHITLIGGGAIPKALESQLLLSDSDVYATYGMTETISHVALRRVRATDKLFRALPGITFQKSDNECLVINAPHLGVEGLITHDVVDLLDQTSFTFLGRADNVINSGGVKIFPEQIERTIEFMFTRPFFIWKKEDAIYGEKVVLYAEGNPWNEARKQALRAYMEKSFRKFEIPNEIHFIERFERTPTDKIIRKNYL